MPKSASPDPDIDVLRADVDRLMEIVRRLQTGQHIDDERINAPLNPPKADKAVDDDEDQK